jgi:hypothetical protein
LGYLENKWIKINVYAALVIMIFFKVNNPRVKPTKH